MANNCEKNIYKYVHNSEKNEAKNESNAILKDVQPWHCGWSFSKTTAKRMDPG